MDEEPNLEMAGGASCWARPPCLRAQARALLVPSHRRGKAGPAARIIGSWAFPAGLPHCMLCLNAAAVHAVGAGRTSYHLSQDVQWPALQPAGPEPFMSNGTLACLLAQQQAGGASCRGRPSNQGGRNTAQPPGAGDSLPCRSRDGKGLAAAILGGPGPIKALPRQQAGKSGAQASPKAPGSVMSLVKGLQALPRPIHRPSLPGAREMSARWAAACPLLAMKISVSCQKHSQPSFKLDLEIGLAAAMQVPQEPATTKTSGRQQLPCSILDFSDVPHYTAGMLPGNSAALQQTICLSPMLAAACCASLAANRHMYATYLWGLVSLPQCLKPDWQTTSCASAVQGWPVHQQYAQPAMQTKGQCRPCERRRDVSYTELLLYAGQSTHVRVVSSAAMPAGQNTNIGAASEADDGTEELVAKLTKLSPREGPPTRCGTRCWHLALPL